MPSPPPLPVVPPVEPASNELVSGADDAWPPYGTSEVIMDGPLTRANVPGCCWPPRPVGCCCCCTPLLGTAVALSNCSRSLPPHSLIRCNSASSKDTSFSRVAIRASFVSMIAVRVVLPGTPPGTATLPPRTVPPLPAPAPPDTLPSPMMPDPANPPKLPPPATGCPEDAVEAYASSSCVCRLFRLSLVALSSWYNRSNKRRRRLQVVDSFSQTFSVVSLSLYLCLFDDVVEMLSDFFDFYFLECEVCGGTVQRWLRWLWLSAASLTHETAPVFVVSFEICWQSFISFCFVCCQWYHPMFFLFLSFSFRRVNIKIYLIK